MEMVFQLSSLLVAPFWLLMIVLPCWRWTERIVGSPWIAAAPAVLYAAFVLPRAGEILESFDSVVSVAALIGTVDGATIAWLHFLAFDLFVGRWIYLDSRQNGVHPLVTSPLLALTFLLGPLGFLGYLLARSARHSVSIRQASLEANA
jgi:hypothetical protein